MALWREALLAREVLRGNTRGYRHHPQLERWERGANAVADATGAGARELPLGADRIKAAMGS